MSQPQDLVQNILSILPDFRKSGKVLWVRSVFEASRPINCEEEGCEKVVTADEVEPQLEEETAISQLQGRTSRKKNKGNEKGGLAPKRLSDVEKLMEADLEVESSLDETFLTIPHGETPRFVLKDSQNAELCAEARNSLDSSQDIELVKSYYSAFKNGKLVQLLRAKFVTEIYICGSLSNISVFATALDATQFGYAITLVGDCLGYRSMERHAEALRRLEASTGCDTISSKDLLEEYQQSANMAPEIPISIPVPRRQASLKTNRVPANKLQAPDIDALMSKLEIGSKNVNTPKSEASQPAKPSDTVVESDGISLSVDSENESQDLDLPTKLPRRPEAAMPANRVPAKIRTRKRFVKKPESEAAKLSNASSDKSFPLIDRSTQPLTQAGHQQRAEKQKEVIEKSSLVAPSQKSSSLPNLPTLEASNEIPKRPIKPLESMPANLPKMESKISRPDAPAMCEGDTTIIHDLLQGELADNIFERVRDEVQWQKMSHQGGDVPRLVAVQGKVNEDRSIPIYRHPADESPALLPFTETVDLIRTEAEKELGHSLNHVLIQFYRDGTDYISEHSDKTLDIVPKTYIVNVSLGAQRTMIFRTKKLPVDKDAKARPAPATRKSVRAPMPHNSMCKVGLATNMRWLHGIRQDKRLASEKSHAELAFGGARISLTFRQIGTFLSADQQKIWGQGAVSKTQGTANSVVNGNSEDAEAMIRAFGQENHSSEFDWEGHYGAGFNVLHLNNTPKLFLSENVTADLTVKLALAHYNINWTEGKFSPSFRWKNGSLQADVPEIPPSLPIKYVDNDLSKSTTTGDLAILLYLNTIYGPQQCSNLEMARLFSRLQVALDLSALSTTPGFSIVSSQSTLSQLNTFAKEGQYITGERESIVDWVLLPLLDKLYDTKLCGFGEGLEGLTNYYLQIREEKIVMEILGRNDVLLRSEVDEEKEEERVSESGGKESSGRVTSAVIDSVEVDSEEESEDD